MKKPFALLAAGTLAALTSLSLAAPAVAATDIADWTFYTDADLGTEGTSYPAYPALSDWFTGRSATPLGTATSGAGLELAHTSGQATQLLNHNGAVMPTISDFDELATYIDRVEITSSNDAAWTFQLPVFMDFDPASPAQFTTLRPVATGDPSSTGQWITSYPISDASGAVVHPANTTDTLANLLSPLFDPADDRVFQVLAFGMWTNSDVDFYTATGFGTKSSFMPTSPSASISPASLSQAATTSTGVTITIANLIPGMTSGVEIVDCSSNDVVHTTSVVPDENGTATVRVVWTSPLAVDRYCFSVVNDVYSVTDAFNQALSGEFSVVANTPALAATGTESEAPAAIAAFAALLGLAAVAIAARRRAANA